MKPIFIFLILLSIGCISCEDVFEPDLTNEKVQLQSPVDHMQTTDSVVNFYWNHTRMLASYQLQVVSPRFDSMVQVFADTITANNQVQLKLRSGTRYEWRVRATNTSSSGDYSTIRSLTINTPTP